MRTIDIKPENIFSNSGNVPFFVLGKDILSNTGIVSKIKDKLSRKITAPVPELWGTLGYANNSKINWQGQLQISEEGNTDSSGTTLSEIKNIYTLIPGLGKDTPVLERFINFDKVDFSNMPETFNDDEIPEIRLTLFLSPHEGAIVYYEHHDQEFAGTEEKEAQIEYILPEATESFSTNRDRLNYKFQLLPKNKIIENTTGGKAFRLDKTKLNKSFIVKILTFKRDNASGNGETVFESLLNSAEGKYNLGKFDPATNTFKEVDHKDVTIDPALKTLMLFHGTFKTTETTFFKMIEQVNGESWLQKIMKDGNYQQILGFTHYTILHDAKTNIRYFKERLGDVSFKNNPVDVVTISRGGLVAKALMCLENADVMPVRKAVLIACANGVGYFETGKKISKLLSVLRSRAIESGQVAAIIATAIAQFSADLFLKMPGAQQLTPGSDRLNELLAAGLKPHNSNSRILPVVGDWDPALVKDKKLIREWGARGLDLVIKTILGPRHDWVVGCDKQVLMPPGADAPKMVKSVHTKYLDAEHCKDDVKGILIGYFAN